MVNIGRFLNFSNSVLLGSLMTGAGMAGLMYYNNTSDDPYVDLKGMENEEKDDEIIKKDDNLYVVGKMDEECSCLEVYGKKIHYPCL